MAGRCGKRRMKDISHSGEEIRIMTVLQLGQFVGDMNVSGGRLMWRKEFSPGWFEISTDELVRDLTLCSQRDRRAFTRRLYASVKNHCVGNCPRDWHVFAYGSIVRGVPLSPDQAVILGSCRMKNEWKCFVTTTHSSPRLLTELAPWWFNDVLISDDGNYCYVWTTHTHTRLLQIDSSDGQTTTLFQMKELAGFIGKMVWDRATEIPNSILYLGHEHKLMQFQMPISSRVMFPRLPKYVWLLNDLWSIVAEYISTEIGFVPSYMRLDHWFMFIVSTVSGKLISADTRTIGTIDPYAKTCRYGRKNRQHRITDRPLKPGQDGDHQTATTSRIQSMAIDDSHHCLYFVDQCSLRKMTLPSSYFIPPPPLPPL